MRNFALREVIKRDHPALDGGCIVALDNYHLLAAESHTSRQFNLGALCRFDLPRAVSSTPW
jgi:hypothetical protein